MDSPLHFPSDADVIAEEASRFRALCPEDQVRAIRDMLNAGEMLMRQSPRAEFLRAYTEEQENLAQQAFKDFVARHAQ
jgi:hypothetical protein